MSDNKPKINKSLKQLIMFGLVGLSNTILSFVIYSGVLFGVKQGFGINESDSRNYIVASVISWIISVSNAYYWSNRYVFKEEKGENRIWWKTLIKTYVSYAGTGLILANILLFLWNDVVHIGQYLGWLADIAAKLGVDITPDNLGSYCASLINLVITIPLNFIINKFWAYGNSNKKADKSNNEEQSIEADAETGV